MLGSEMPHLFKETKDHNPEGVKAVSLFFDEDSLGKQFFETNELQVLIEMLRQSARGLKVKKTQLNAVHTCIIETINLKEEHLYIRFLEILSKVARGKTTFLNEGIALLKNNHPDSLNEVVDYVLQNFEQEIKIEKVAKMSFLSRSHFSAAFKLKTGKTFIEFLNTIRIENACLDLKNKQTAIEQACYSSGFRNVSNFTRQFKRIKQMTPSQYRKIWQIEESKGT